MLPFGRWFRVANARSSLCAALALGAVSCADASVEGRSADPRPNILLISLDTTRPDHLSVYGYARATSPVLSRLASEGILFETAYAPTATTGPTHVTVFTARYPIDHGVLKNGQVLSRESETLAERLSEEGFETGAVVSSFVLSRKFGYGRGFSAYDDDFSQSEGLADEVIWEGMRVEGKFSGTGGDTTRRALEWLDRRAQPERPFFLFVHYFDPHAPYLAPAEFDPGFDPKLELAVTPSGADDAELQREVAAYDRALAYTDREVGRLLDALDAAKLADHTLVVVIGDHGEGLMQHGHMHHGVHIYEEAVRVPLIMRWTERWPTPRRIAGPVQLVDLAPTLLRLAGASAETGVWAGPGFELEPSTVAEVTDRAIFLYRRHYQGGRLSDGLYAKGEKFGVRLGRWKLIYGPEEGTLELFDLEADPDESTNLVRREPEVAARLAERLREWTKPYRSSVNRARSSVNRAAGGGSSAQKAEEPSAADRARLRALGYVD